MSRYMRRAGLTDARNCRSRCLDAPESEKDTVYPYSTSEELEVDNTDPASEHESREPSRSSPPSETASSVASAARTVVAATPLRLLGQVSERARYLHYSLRTEE